MKTIYLAFVLVFGMFAQKGWAPPPGQGGATVGAAAIPDISKCDLNPANQTKVKVKGKDGKEHFICTGQAICGGKSVPVSCKVSEREPCPLATKCITFEGDDAAKSDTLEYEAIKMPFTNPQRAFEYWTPERMKKAKAIPLPVLEELPKDVKFEINPPGLQDFEREVAQPQHQINYEGEDLPKNKSTKVTSDIFQTIFRPTGKLFMEGDNSGYCSGSVIYSKERNKRVVISAAHCFFNRKTGKWATSVKFKPGYGLNVPPVEFYGTSLTYSNGFVRGGDNMAWNGHDFVIIELNAEPMNNCCYGLLFASQKPPGVAVGYPYPETGKEYFTGEDMFVIPIRNVEVSQSRDPRKEPFRKIYSDMTGGSSGGPWIGFSRKGIYGYIFGINGHFRGSEKNKMYSPFFGAAVEKIYDCFVDDKKCGSKR